MMIGAVSTTISKAASSAPERIALLSEVQSNNKLQDTLAA